MIVLNLTCEHQHRFEGWFASNDEYARQSGQGAVSCPVCDSRQISKLPSNPRIGRAGQTEAAAPPQEQQALQTALEFLARLAAGSENVGQRFPEEARRIHYDEAPARSIRGVATRKEAVELLEEGITVLPLPLPPEDERH